MMLSVDVTNAHLNDVVDKVDIEDDGTLSTKRWKRQKNESDINLVTDMKVHPEFFDGEQHMKIDIVESNMCGKGRVNQVPSLAL
uniref:Uncharacterized protein n=1 Tax=Tanacetum cinerariifolium TaxID=118510 RepID=A0A6L2MJ80_TANCI|nr:hypothetical protein [Tanacetum cinerariifolium]